MLLLVGKGEGKRPWSACLVVRMMETSAVLALDAVVRVVGVRLPN